MGINIDGATNNYMYKSASRLIACLSACMTCLSPMSASQLVITGNSSHPIRILCDGTRDSLNMGRNLSTFLNKRHCPTKLVTHGSLNTGYPATQLVLSDVSNLKNIAPDVTTPVFTKSARDEAYLFDVRMGKSGPIILMVGKSGSGVRAAAARFICKVANDGERLTMNTGNELNDPFIKRRLIFVGDPARRQVPFGSPFKDADYETWALPKIRAYPQLFWQFGFNGLQAGEYRGYSSVPDGDMPRIRKAIQTLNKGAKDYSLYTSLFIWGDCLYDEGATYSWNNPNEQKIMRLYQKDLARDYAPLMDHFIIHVGDPGGCSRDGCDLYKTPQQITASVLEQFRKFNPKVTGTLSTWANSYFWRKSPQPLNMANYGPFFPSMASQTEFNEAIPDGAKFMDTTFMPADAGIAMHRSYNEQQADMIRSHNKPVGIWSWYIGDNEMLNTYWFTMKQTDQILSAMPDKASTQVDWETHELCWHGWPNIITAYVGSQKLWNLRRPLADIEREFCVAGFGPQNAKAVLALYHAVENGGAATLPNPKIYATQQYHDELSKILDAAATIKFRAGWEPNFAFPVPVRKYVAMLTARVKLIRAVSDAQMQLNNIRKQYGITQNLRVNALYFKAEDNRGGEVIAARNYEVQMPFSAGQTVGVRFQAVRDFQRAGIVTFGNPGAGMTISLYDQPGGKLLERKVYSSLPAEQWITLDTYQPAGSYYLEVSDPTGEPTGIYGSITGVEGCSVYQNGQAVPPEPAVIKQLKQKLINDLPNLPIDPMWKMDATIAISGYTVPTFAQMIERM